MLVIRLTRFGKKKQPFYRIVVAQKSAPIQGKYLDKIGHYNPLSNPSDIFVDKEKVKKWLKNGAKPSDTVNNLLVVAGVLKKKVVTNRKLKKKEKKGSEENQTTTPKAPVEQKPVEKTETEKTKEQPKEQPKEETKTE